MNIKTILLFAVLINYASFMIAQVPARKDPSHHIVLENKYIRLLDAWVLPGDTTLFHIHSTPTVFISLSNTHCARQIKGRKDWADLISEVGKVLYQSFSPNILIHRVTNKDTIPLHSNEIEFISSFNGTGSAKPKPLPFPLLSENEKAYVYRLTNQNNGKSVNKKHGPIVAELTSGDKVVFHFPKTRDSKEINTGQYLYIEPGTRFYVSTNGSADINLVLIEVK